MFAIQTWGRDSGSKKEGMGAKWVGEKEGAGETEEDLGILKDPAEIAIAHGRGDEVPGQ